MALEFTTWNVKDAFSDPMRAPIIVAAVEREMPDVVVFSEAYSEHDTTLIDDVQDDLLKKGYYSRSVLYADADDRRDRHGLLMLARSELFVRDQAVRFGGRNALRMIVEDPTTKREVEVIGVHGDDRSEDSRLWQFGDLATLIDASQESPTDRPFALIGDLNTDPGKTLYARAVHTIGKVAHYLPKQQPNPEAKYNKYLRMVSLADRVSQMTSARSYNFLKSIGLRDVSFSPTIPAENPRLQLDHIMISSELHLKGSRLGDYNAAADHGLYDPVSDHLELSAIVQVRPELSVY